MNEKIISEDYLSLDSCPWCDSKRHMDWGNAVRGFITLKCMDCRLIYVKNHFSDIGQQKFYKQYLSKIHQADISLNSMRDKMYQIEFAFVRDFAPKGQVLDVGCSGGYFLNLFKANGFQTYGVELGDEAAIEAAKNHVVWLASFPDLEPNLKFDLIIFRGVIEHVNAPRVYLDKAITLLKDKGVIFITSTPNAKAFCCELYKDKWNQHVPEAHIYHFTEKHFDDYFLQQGFQKIAERYFYEETPYANVEKDILRVAEAIQRKQEGLEITDTSPAFWGNMMSLIYGRSI